ncbi:MAG: DUF3427 domain-containing protein [Candidatus Omnitrophica bacterium]|nr:DUF3427 domain-containing protein [Candidatus Omnitrophota bacterium]
MKYGIYEQVINLYYQNQLDSTSSDSVNVKTSKIDPSESYIILSNYINQVLTKALRYFKGELKIDAQVLLCNKIIKLMLAETGQKDLSEFLISKEAELLLHLIDFKDNPLHVGIVRPDTSISQSSLFTGAHAEPSLGVEMAKEIASADRIDLLVSFIKWSGLRLIKDALEVFTKREGVELRVITTSYMGATDYKAVKYLAELPNTKVMVSYDTKRTRLHAKAYLFHRNTGFSTAYIGSSNLSNAAISSGLEWNLKVTRQDSANILDKFSSTFETYWNDKEFTRFDPNKGEQLVDALRNERNIVGNEVRFDFDIRPYPYQEEILNKLQAEREVHGKFKNLVVAATGTGKTVISAFDYKRFCANNTGKANKLLFVAHRKEILEQSLQCFRSILHDRNFGDLWVGEHFPEQYDHLFVSIQTFNSQKLHEKVKDDYYDFVVVDEFHHAAAPSYQSLLSTFKPKVLLGLTATPDRMDQKSVLSYFEDRLSAELNLKEAIERKLLCPFQYFGVTDNVDLRSLNWTRGKYDVNELEDLYLENDHRSLNVLKSLEDYVENIHEATGLGFCVSRKHAEYMAKFFNKHGVMADFITGESNSEQRRNIQKKLIKKEINFIFVVDLYNEGVDLPAVDTILFLRPTESLTVFMQQLGRGLRLSPDTNKECLTVLDFIGQAHQNYCFEDKFRSLVGKTYNSIEKEIENEFAFVPKGCFIKLEKLAREFVLKNVQQAINNSRASITKRIRTFEADSQIKPTLRNYLKYYNLDINSLYKRGTWTSLCIESGIKEDFECEHMAIIDKGLHRLTHINSRRLINFLKQQLNNKHDYDYSNLSEDEKRMMLMFHYSMWKKPNNDLGFTSVNDTIAKLVRYDSFEEELKDLLDYKYEKIDFLDKKLDLGFPCPLDLHCNYTLDEILASIGKSTLNNKFAIREGTYYCREHNVDLFFVTLNKSEKDYSPSTMYEDYAIDEYLFHWQSQSGTSPESPAGIRYINQEKSGGKVLFFVRSHKKENGLATPYSYLGPANYVEHSGSKPISFIWRLENPIPAFLIGEVQSLGIG